MEAMRHRGFSVVGAILGFILFLFVALVFSTIGGLLGAALFRKKGPAFVPPPPDLPPPPPLP
jgi:hypothetical protein